MYFKTLLFFSAISLSFAQIYWNNEVDGAWAFYCQFNTPDLASLQANTYTSCRQQCKSNSACTNYNWDASLIICKLKSGSVAKANAVYVNNGNLCCGIVNTSKQAFLSLFSFLY
jgi:hypothetical protein